MRYVQLASTAFVLVHRSISPPHRRSIIRQYASTSSSNLDNNYQDLVAWLQREGSFIHESIQLKPSTRGGGYGAFVTNSVEEGTLLFSIPRKVCVTMEKVTADETCGGSFQKVIERAGPGGNTVVLAGYLAKEWLKTIHDMKDGKDVSNTFFGPYLRTLPWARGINNQEHILFWDDEEIESTLKGSMCYSEAKAIREEVSFAIRIINGIIGDTVRAYRGELSDTFQWPWQRSSRVGMLLEGLPEAVKGSFVCVLTRAFQDGDNDQEKLVPLLDMLQHSDEPNVSHAMRKEDGSVEVRARRALEATEELLNQYRPEIEETMPYHRFFTRFGFVPGIQEAIPVLLKDRSSIFFPQKAEV